jgi:uncharacterized membrane protein
MAATARTLALAAVAALGLGVAGAEARERCYGVAEAGENEGIDGREDPGSATVDYQGNAWTWVADDSCLTMPLPPQPDGTPRRGSFEPLDRDRP